VAAARRLTSPAAPARGALAELRAAWPLLLTATLACGSGVSSLLYYSFGLLVEPLQQEFGWSRGEVTSAMFFGSGGLVVAAPLVGWLIDRCGARKVALWAIPAFAATLVVLARFDGPLPLFYSVFVLIAVAGCGTTPILYTRAVAGSFDAARGFALGVTLAGPGTAAVVLPPFLLGVIGAHGWRGGVLSLAVIALVPWLLVHLWLGQAPAVPGAPAAPRPAGMRRRDALRTRAFWIIVLGFGAIAVACSALVVHMVPMLRDAGVPPARAAHIASLIGVGVILGRLGIGWSIDRVFAPHVAAAIFAVTAVGCALLLMAGTAQAPLAAFLVGFALGAEVDLLAYLTSRYFGLRHYGFLYASVYACFWTGIALGPAIAGQLFDRHGNYTAALVVVIALLACGVVAALLLPRFDADGARPAARSP
jgi:MFS family permease